MLQDTIKHALFILLTLAMGATAFIACDDGESDDEDSQAGDTGADGDTDGDSDGDTDADAGDVEVADAGDTAIDAGSEPGTTAEDTENTAGTDDGAAFGGTCTDSSECAEGVCHEFGQLGWVCTIPCENGDQCPEGSEGKKCNQQNVCRP